MAVIVYPNGLTEDYRPNNLTFTESELLFLFTEFPEVKSVRIQSVVNTWCIYGLDKDNDMESFNRIVSELTGERVFTHALFIHDSEINPDWNITDDVLYKGYIGFLKDIKKMIYDISSMIMNEIVQTDGKEKTNMLPQLTTLGITNDDSKRILFGFNFEDQTSEFFNNEEYTRFCQKVYDYLSVHTQTIDPFMIYEDKKAVIIIESEKVKIFLDSLLENFKNREEYEICRKITGIMEEWEKTHPKKTKSSKENTNE